MQLDSASVELEQHLLDPRLDRRMVRAVTGDEFLDDGLQPADDSCVWGMRIESVYLAARNLPRVRSV